MGVLNWPKPVGLAGVSRFNCVSAFAGMTCDLNDGL